MKKLSSTKEEIKVVEKELAELDHRRKIVLDKLEKLRNKQFFLLKDSGRVSEPIFSRGVSHDSAEADKIDLFRDLFKGREDVFPRRFESIKSGKSGYQPECKHQWIRGLCRKPRVKCADCDSRDFTPVTDEVIRNHLVGRDLTKPRSTKDFTIGVYPLLPDETCWFVAVDFDKKEWEKDVKVYVAACREQNVPIAVERSRSGRGAHTWLFFSEPIPARLARQLSALMLTVAMRQRPELGFDSYDRFFPSQDTIPKGGFGNLIALPLQQKLREEGNTVFIDDEFIPHPDQWAFLSSLRRMTRNEVEQIIEKADPAEGILGVRAVITDEESEEPWFDPPSGVHRKPDIKGGLPDEIEIVLGNQIYIPKTSLPPQLINRLIRVAAFQNPEFYKAQAMRFPTYNKPRIISCCEDFSKHLGIPIGCLEDVQQLFDSVGIRQSISDERHKGFSLNIQFRGKLRPEQQKAADVLLQFETGVLSAATAFGKTVIGAYLIAKRGANTLIIVHRKQLLEQWRVRLAEFLSLNVNQIGQVGGGKRNPTGVVDVCMIQSLSKKGIVDDIVGDYGHLIVDECHHISAPSFEIVARQCKAKFVTGLSATVVRKDGHHPIIYMNCGPVRYRVSDKKQASSRSFEHRVIVRKTQFKMPVEIDSKSYGAMQEVYRALSDDDRRNKMIVNDVVSNVKANRFPVVLTERKDHLIKLETLLSEHVANVIVFKGGMGKRQKKAAMEKLASVSKIDSKVILATGRYLGEGFDEARLDTLFLTLPVSWKGTVVQYAGRLHRNHHLKKEVLIYDYVDLNEIMLARMYERRRRSYKSIGYKIEN
jgi:superfamily II DNA or RNA helicase